MARTLIVLLFASLASAQIPIAGPIAGGGGSGGGGGTVTSVGGTAPIVSSGGNAPVISCSNATTMATGCVQPDGTTITISGGVISAAAGGGGVTSVTATSPITSSGGTTPNISATYQGNGSKIQLSTGTTTTNDCVKFDANGNTVDAGAACGSGGGGPTLETNGTNNSSQSILNIQNGTNTTASNPSGGNVQVNVATATSSTLGVVKNDGSTISNTSGTISCTTETTSQLGCVKADGSTITTSTGTLSAAATTIQGTSCTPGSTCSPLTLQTNGTNNTTQTGLNLVNGTNCTITNTSGNSVSFTCSQTNITGNAATATNLASYPSLCNGTTQFSEGLSSGSNNCATLQNATSAQKGVVEGDGSTITLSSGTISCTTSTSSQLGCAKPDGSTITASAGAYTTANTTINGTTCTPGGSCTITASSALTQICQTTLSMSASTLSCSGISGSYTNLQFIIMGRSNYTGAQDVLTLEFNTDTGSNYSVGYYYSTNGTPGGGSGNSNTPTGLGWVGISGAGALANTPGTIVAFIPGYAGTTFSKVVTYQQSEGDASSSAYHVSTSNGAYMWNPSTPAAITAITIGLQNGMFIAGSQLTVYGIQ